jgi:hypothetical protein
MTAIIDRIVAAGSGSGISVGMTPASESVPWLDASTANSATGGGVRVPRDVRRDLEKAGVQAAPPGKLLALAPLDASLQAAGFDATRRMEIKRALLAVKQLDERQRS